MMVKVKSWGMQYVRRVLTRIEGNASVYVCAVRNNAKMFVLDNNFHVLKSICYNDFSVVLL